MPKLFPISIEVEEVALGRVLRSLNTMAGVVRLHLNLKTEKARMLASDDEDEGESYAETPAIGPLKMTKHGRYNGRGLPPSQNQAYRLIAEVLQRTPAHLNILAAALQRAGIDGPQAINGYIHRLKNLGFIHRTAPGTYRLTPKGEKAIFRPDNGSNKRHLPHHKFKLTNNLEGVRGLVLRTLVHANSVPSNEMIKLVQDKGYSPKNMSTTGMKMRNEGLIEFHDGQYFITDTGREVISRPPENGSNKEEVTANG